MPVVRGNHEGSHETGGRRGNEFTLLSTRNNYSSYLGCPVAPSTLVPLTFNLIYLCLEIIPNFGSESNLNYKSRKKRLMMSETGLT